MPKSYKLPCTFVPMAITKLPIDEFLTLIKHNQVLDVRSPGEFKHAHIPGAISFPLFTDEERKIVGTAYKQESKQIAVKIGLKYFGKKMVKMVEEVENLQSSFYNLKNNVDPDEKRVLLHCWRGGMRSAGVAWLLDLYGFKVFTLVGGYKAYRNWVLQQFEKEYPINILGGFTGSGKTEVLHELAKTGQQIIDLEGLASHKGSAFGAIGQPPQPTQEQFENLLAKVLSTIKCDAGSILYLEDESQRIGEVNIPSVLFKQMREKKVLFLNIPFEERLNFIVANYGKFKKEELVNAVIRIKKKLGGLETKTAINALVEDDVKNCFVVLLQYYDKLYQKGLLKRDQPNLLVQTIECKEVDAAKNAVTINQLSISK